VDTDTVSLFLALLAVVAEAATVAAIVLAVGGRFSPTLRRLGGQVVESVVGLVQKDDLKKVLDKHV